MYLYIITYLILCCIRFLCDLLIITAIIKVNCALCRKILLLLCRYMQNSCGKNTSIKNSIFTTILILFISRLLNIARFQSLHWKKRQKKRCQIVKYKRSFSVYWIINLNILYNVSFTLHGVLFISYLCSRIIPKVVIEKRLIVNLF